MYLQDESPRKGPHRERFFSSMNYDEYEMHFGPPKPLLRPVADPQVELDDFKLDSTEPDVCPNQLQDWSAMGFGRSRGFTLPVIREGKSSQQASNLASDRPQSSVNEMPEEQQPLDYKFKRSHSRMRSNSENPNLLILSLLEKAERRYNLGKAGQKESSN